MLCMEYAQQLVFLNHEKCGWCNGCSRPHPNRLARHAALAKKITWAKHRDYRFSSGSVYHGKFHASPLDVHDAIRSLALRDRKSTRLNSSHPSISYAVFCLKKKN